VVPTDDIAAAGETPSKIPERHGPRPPGTPARTLEIHHEVLDGLRHPARGGMRGGAEDAAAAVGMLDHGEDVLALARSG